MTLAKSACENLRVVVETAARHDFCGFQETTLLESGALPIAEIAELAMREGQCTNPYGICLVGVPRFDSERLHQSVSSKNNGK